MVKKIILMLLVLMCLTAIQAEPIVIESQSLQLIIDSLKKGTVLVSEGLSEVKTSLEQSEQNQSDLQKIIEQQAESIQNQQYTLQVLETEQTVLKADLTLSNQALSSWKASAEAAAKRDQKKIDTQQKRLKLYDWIITGEGIAIGILGIFLIFK